MQAVGVATDRARPDPRRVRFTSATIGTDVREALLSARRNLDALWFAVRDIGNDAPLFDRASNLQAADDAVFAALQDLCAIEDHVLELEERERSTPENDERASGEFPIERHSTMRRRNDADLDAEREP